MQLNIYSVLGVALALSSMVFPWVSFCSVCAFKYGMITMSLDVGLIKSSGTSGYCSVNGTSFSYDHFVGWLQWPTLSSTWTLLAKFYFLQVAAFLLFLYSICLIIHGAFASNSWSKAGRRTLMVAGFLSLTSIILYLIGAVGYLSIFHGVSPFTHGLFTIDGAAVAGLIYFNTGFFIAILSTLSAFLSWWRPKFALVSAVTRIEGYSKLRDFLCVSEKEKLATIFLSSFQIVLLFTILYFILPAMKI